MENSQQAGAGQNRSRWQTIALFGLIFFVGMNLRTVILGVPPVLPQIQDDLDLSYTQTGFLTALPVLFMGGAAWVAAWAIDRIGGRRVVTVGLALLAAGAILRAPFPSMIPLYLATAMLSLGIALAQTAIPVLVRLWFPSRIGLASALYTDGIIAGEALAVAVTGPVLLGWLGEGAWRGSFVAWGIPVVVCVALWIWLAPAAGPRRRLQSVTAVQRRTQTPSLDDEPPRRRARFWHLGLVSAAGGLIYFTMNTWIPPYNVAIGETDQTAVSLTALNIAQLPVVFGLTFVAQRIVGQRWPFVVTGISGFIVLFGLWASPPSWQPFWAGLSGATSVVVLLLGTALPPLLAGPHQVARLTGLTLTVNYGVAFVGPLAGGWLWDNLGQPELAFAPILLACLSLVILGPLLPLTPKAQQQPAPVPANTHARD